MPQIALLIYHVLFLISGIVMAAIGLSTKSRLLHYDLFLDYRFYALPTIMIVTGCLIFFICTFSFCCVINETYGDGGKPPRTATYTLGLTVTICILELFAGSAAFTLRHNMDSVLHDELLATMKEYEFDSDYPNSVTSFWNHMQFQFECCGADGPGDWTGVLHQQLSEFGDFDDFTRTTQSNELPISCCDYEYIGPYLGCFANITGSYFSTGCLDMVGSELKDQTLVIGLVDLIMPCLQMCGILFVFRCMRRSEYNYNML